MLQLLGSASRLCDGISRREWLRVGGLGAFGLSLPHLYAAQAPTRPGTFGRAKSVIVLWMSGGPPQQETWDPKPDAPAEIRGPFGTIPTSVPGYRVNELMPRTAAMIHKLAVLRAVATDNPGHAGGSYEMLTAVENPGGKGNENIKASRSDFPYFGSIVKRFRQPVPGMPTTVVLPQWVFSVPEWPGQNGGFLGSQWDPWHVLSDPAAPDFRLDDLKLHADTPSDRLSHRRTLLDRTGDLLDRAHSSPSALRYQQQTVQAFDLLGSQRVRSAFDLNREPAALRDWYGRNSFGQGCLLARRLVEAGVALVQVNWRRVPLSEDPENEGMWDLHKSLADTLKNRLMPRMDLGYTALLDDLAQRGLLDETLVVWMGEMGRTPKMEALPEYRAPGRNHWGHVFSIALAGAGVRGGTIYGASDKIAGFPKDGKVTPPDVTATIFHSLGLSPRLEIHDRLNRPLPISTGKVIEGVY